MRAFLKRLAITLALALPFTAAFGDPANWDRSVANTLVHEGYTYEKVPGDPGGPTKYGITIHDVRAYLKPHATAADVKALTLDQAKVIYRKHYWNAVGADSLPRGLDYVTFDYAVNAGLGRALPALHACQARGGSTADQIKCVCDKRMAFQMGLPSRFNKFKRGWRNRITSARVIGLNMDGVEKAAPGNDLFLIPRHGPGKAYEEEIVDE